MQRKLHFYWLIRPNAARKISNFTYCVDNGEAWYLVANNTSTRFIWSQSWNRYLKAKKYILVQTYMFVLQFKCNFYLFVLFIAHYYYIPNHEKIKPLVYKNRHLFHPFHRMNFNRFIELCFILSHKRPYKDTLNDILLVVVNKYHFPRTFIFSTIFTF